MIAIYFKFLRGYYHATPWGRHVNEADVEWPPSPWRFVRTLISLWYTKVDQSGYGNNVFENLIDKMCQCPVYSLPEGVHAHIRYYMPSIEDGSKQENTLIFDGFLGLRPGDELVMLWRDLTIDDKEKKLLKELLSVMNYFGRSESWVEAGLYEKDLKNIKINCFPLEENHDGGGEIVRLYLPLNQKSYDEWQNKKEEEVKDVKGAAKVQKTGKKGQKVIPNAIIQDRGWLDCIAMDTSDMRKEGWSCPPGAIEVDYLRHPDCIRHKALQTNKHSTLSSLGDKITTVSFLLEGKPLPRVEDTVKIGELFRRALLSKCRESAPWYFYGRNESGDYTLNHSHAFYLPEDRDGDGRIDHVVVFVSGGLDEVGFAALCKIDRDRIFARDREYFTILECYGGNGLLSNESALFGSSCQWISVTPYLHPWHKKKNFDTLQQIVRECKKRGNLPSVENVEFFENVNIRGRARRPLNFHRFRSKKNLVQPDRRGCFIKLTFSQVVEGPLCLGFGCHYGLGLMKVFKP